LLKALEEGRLGFRWRERHNPLREWHACAARRARQFAEQVTLFRCQENLVGYAYALRLH
jgi:hypothetical protein